MTRRSFPLADVYRQREPGPDTRGVNRYCFFVLEVQQAWVDRSHADPRTLHHRGMGAFMVAGPTIRLRSKMR
jgi:hypothetical protein